MPTYNYLPGVIVNTLDGGLATAFAPQDDSILVIGTAGSSPTGTPYQVTDRAVSAAAFGYKGTLTRAIEENAIYSDNIIAFRMGTSPMKLAGVGVNTIVTITPGFSITFGPVTINQPGPSFPPNQISPARGRRREPMLPASSSCRRVAYRQ